MRAKKLHFPNFYLLLVLFFTIGCSKKESITIKYKINTAYKIYIDYAEKYFEDSKYNNAFFYYNKSKSTCNPNKDTDEIIYSLLKMAAIQQIQGDYSSSEATATEAILFFQKNTNSYYKCAIYNILGINYKNLFDYNNAIYYYNQASNLAEDELQKAILKNNIAVVYMDKNDFYRAIQVLLPLTLKQEVLANDENHARVLDNLGFSYFKTGNSKKGLDYITQALKIRKQIKDDFGITTTYQHLSEFYSKTNPTLAYHYAQLSYAKATQVNNANDRLRSLELLIKNSTGNSLKKFTTNYLRINDSLNQARQKAKNQFAKIKYDSTKEKNENLKLKAQKAENALELEEQKNRNYILCFVTFIVILLAVFLYYYSRNRNKKKELEAVYESETRMSKKLHDELANDVYQTMAFAETQDLQNPLKKEMLLGNLDKIYARTRNISRENSTIETGAKFEEELKQMLSGYNNNQVQIIIKDNGDINWTKIQREKKIAIYRVLQELLVNMKKHSQCSFVIIGFESHDKFIQINYSDNGIGVDQNLILKNGLLNVENRMNAINGTITFESETDKGFKATLTIPK
jgi:signal transduction histidine kinase